MADSGPLLRLHLRSGEGAGTTHELSPGEHRVGRLSACDIVSSDESVSRIHARLSFDPSRGVVRVADAGSENGVSVNGRRVIWSDLRAGDRLELGALAFEVSLPEGLSLPERRQEPFRAPRRPLAPALVALIASGALLAYAALRTPPSAPGPDATEQPATLEPSAPDAPLEPPALEDPLASASTVSAAPSAQRNEAESPALEAQGSVPPRADGAGGALAAPRTARRRRPRPDPIRLEPLEASIRNRYPEDPHRAEVLWRYVQGDLTGARRLADRSDPELAATLDALVRRQARVRTEISADPERARSLLANLERAESTLLPVGVQSYGTKDLTRELADAFARRGASEFEAARYGEAFVAWTAGRALDAGHPTVRAGLARLRRRAEQLAEEAEIAGQRGDKLACDRWRRVAAMTAPGSELNARARRRISAVCP